MVDILIEHDMKSKHGSKFSQQQNYREPGSNKITEKQGKENIAAYWIRAW